MNWKETFTAMEFTAKKVPAKTHIRVGVDNTSAIQSLTVVALKQTSSRFGQATHTGGHHFLNIPGTLQKQG